MKIAVTIMCRLEPAKELNGRPSP